MDATGAYSAYTFYRTLLKGGRIVAARQDKSADETTADGDNLLVWTGTSLLRVKGHVSKEELAVVVGIAAEGERTPGAGAAAADLYPE